MTTIANHQQAHAAPPQAGPLQQFAADGRPIHEAVADVLARGLPLNREMPADFDGRWRRAELYAASGLMPKGMDTPEKVFVALDLGAAHDVGRPRFADRYSGFDEVGGIEDGDDGAVARDAGSGDVPHPGEMSPQALDHHFPFAQYPVDYERDLAPGGPHQYHRTSGAVIAPVGS